MKILVTGACGFVGPYLIQALLSQGHEVVASVYSLEAFEQKADKDSRASFVELDITESVRCGELIAEIKPDAVFHLAGIAFAPEAASHFDIALQANVGGVFHLCQGLIDHCPKAHLLFVSSGEVYGAIDESVLPISEVVPAEPMNPYSLTKLQAEKVIEFFRRKNGLEATIMRPFNHIGPGQSEKFVCSNFAAQLARISAGKQPAIMRVGNLAALRDFTDVRDIVAGYVKLLGAEPATYNLSSGKSHSIQEMLDSLIEISGVEVAIEQDAARMRPSEVPEIRGSSEKLRRAIEWEPQISFRDSLADVYQSWTQLI